MGYPDMLTILSHPASKYYSVETEADMQNLVTIPHEGTTRIVFRGTIREMIQFINNTQLNIFAGTTHAQDQKDIPPRE